MVYVQSAKRNYILNISKMTHKDVQQPKIIKYINHYPPQSLLAKICQPLL